MKSVIILPTYNEAENIQDIIQKIFDCQPLFNIIIVDDNSPDGTGDIADELANNDSRVSVIHRGKKTGLGTAYVMGFKAALEKGADLIFEMDADLSHDPKYLKDFLIAIKKHDLVIGSRYVKGGSIEGWKFLRILLSKLANLFVSCFMIKPLRDFTAGYRCYRRDALEKIDLDKIKADGYAFQIEMIYHVYNTKSSICEIPIIFKERKKGYSKISKSVIIEAFWLTLKLRSSSVKIIKNIFKYSA